MHPLARLAAYCQALRGWRRLSLAFALGACATLALPPIHLYPALAVGFTGLVWLLGGAERGRGAFALGWWFAFGHHVFGLYWISNALLVDVARFWWMIPFALTGLPALLGMFGGVASWLAWRLGPRAGLGGALALAAFWTLAELARGHVLTGFPWNLPAYIWTDWPAAMQGASLVGAYGLSLLTVLLAVLPALAVDRRGVRIGLIGLGAGGVLLGWGYARLPDGPAPVHPGLVLRLVQPSIPQSEKWRGDRREAIFHTHLNLSQRESPSKHAPSAVIWAESATPFLLEQDQTARALIAQSLRAIRPGALLLTGAPRLTGVGDAAEIWNSLVVVNDAAVVVGTYDKAHLVPFGEYVPLSGILPIAKVTHGARDYSAGPGPQTIDLPGLPAVGPLICYEAIFPGAVTDSVRRPAWLLNLTNDGWYGYSSGPFQHFAIVSMRAIEEGLPVVRVANNGVSGVIDAFGRVTTRMELDFRGSVDAELPLPLAHVPIFPRGGNFLVWAGLAIMIAYTTSLRTLKNASRKNS